eukprot:3304988-Prymnesium_polylepis.1
MLSSSPLDSYSIAKSLIFAAIVNRNFDPPPRLTESYVVVEETLRSAGFGSCAVLTPKRAGLHERAPASQSRTTVPHCRELSLSGSVGVQPLSS